MKVFAFVLLGLIAAASAEVHFKETFQNLDAWVVSKFKEAEGTNGKFELSAGKYFGDAKEDQGLKTSQDARFYQISAKFPEFSNEGKDLIIQYSVKHEQNIDCGGGYIKILPKGLDQEKFNGDSEYNIMFGPDICGTTKKTHVIFTHDGKNHLVKKDIKCESDQWTHLYTLILRPDNTYEVLIDGSSVSKGSLTEDFDILPPKEIKDPKAKKPSDWVDEKTIADPADKKPEGYDDIPAQITDPDAKKPDDWDDELDGEWEAPTIDNPEFKGEWKPKMMPNPAYKGEWVHPMVPNPDYVDNDKLYLFPSNNFVGFEIWQVKAGTIFDNIIVTDDINEANKLAEVTKKLQQAEKKAEEEERKKREEEAKSQHDAQEADEFEEEEEEVAEKPTKDEL
jgi:calreticulin